MADKSRRAVSPGESNLCLGRDQGACRECPAGRGDISAGRRRFLKAVGAAALATQVDLLNFTSSLFAAEAASASGPRVAVVYCRKEKGGGCVWPPSSTEELAETQQLLNRIMEEAAAKHGVDLTILTERVTDVDATLEKVR